MSNSLILCHSRSKIEIILRLLIFAPESLWKWKLNTLPGRMLLIRRKKSKGKYQNGSLTSSDAPKKLVQKSHILTLYRVSHSEDLRILDLQSISIGFHTVKMYHFWTNFFGEMMEVREPFWYFFYRIFSDQKHSPRNCQEFADVKYLALIVHSRREKNLVVMSSQNQGNEHQHNKKKLNSVKSH